VAEVSKRQDFQRKVQAYGDFLVHKAVETELPKMCGLLATTLQDPKSDVDFNE